MITKRWKTSLPALLCLLSLMLTLFSGCRGSSKIEIVFDMNWKEAVSAPASIEVKVGEPYGQLPEITEVREGYTFGGWYLNSDCDGEEVTAETVVTSSVSHVLYAKWIGNKITVSFDLQGGTINGVSNVEDAVVTVGNVYSMMAIPEDPEKESSSFLGWYYDPEGTEGPVRTSTKVEKTEDHTLYAVWQEYQLFYDFENGKGLEVFAAAGNIQYGIAQYNGSDQLNISNSGTDKADGTALQMWIPLKTGTRVTMDLTFAGELPSEDARMYMFCYGLNASGTAITDGVLDITESETHRKWYHGNGYRAMQKDGVWYYGDEGNWHEGNTCKFEMIVMEDCAGLYLMFSLGSELEPAQFAQNDIYIDNIEFTPNYYRVLGDGMMGSSPHAATDKGIYFTMKKNDMPYDSDWEIYYDATSADNIKIIRNGKVYRIAQTNCDNIVKFSETDYYLRLEEYTIGPAYPFTNEDIFIVEGDFSYEGNIITIKKNYIYYDGGSWVFADQLPAELAPASEQASNFPDPYYGILRSHEGGAAEGGIHFRLSDNGLPFGEDWSVYYDATTPDNIKIIRDGKVYRAAKVGCDNICKFTKDGYYLRLESYTIGGFAPYTTKDIIIVEGDFVYEDSTLTINKTYIYYNGSEWVFTTKLPAELAPESEEPVTPAELPEGVMGMGLGATDTGIYFTMKENGLPYGDWDVYYDATTENNIKIIRDGKVYGVANIDCDNISKFSPTDYYLRLESYTIGGFAPFTTKDIFIVEGDFTYADSTLSIKKTYIYYDGTIWAFTTELPQELAPESEDVTTLPDPYAGILRTHEAGAAEGGIHFRLSDNGLPYGKDWDVYYDATTADNIKIIRDGKVYRAAEVGCDNICKFSKDEYYLRLESYTIGGYAPYTTKDIIIIEGDFTYEDATLRIDKTYIYYDGTAWVFTTQLPAELAPETEEVAPDPLTGVLCSHEAGAAEGGIYFRLSDNGLPHDKDWAVYYDATTADNIKIIRDGKVYRAAEVGCDNICKFSKDEYYLRLESYTIGGYAPYTTKDIIIVEGDFTYEDATLSIDKTYIYYNGSQWVFTTKLPEELAPETEVPVEPEKTNDGMMSSSPNGATETGIYFTMKDNGLPFGDWDVYYGATTANNIKIIREGKVYAAALAGCDNICKFSKTDYYLRLESYTIGGYAPISTKDIFIVEGDFTYKDATLSLNKTYIYHDGTAWVFATELPEELKPETEEPVAPEETNDGVMSSSPNGATENGIYFTMKDNGLPFGDWDVYYGATAANNIQIIREGKVYDAAVAGRDNICKFSKTDYYLRLESYTIGGYAPISTKDIFVVEGNFTYEDAVLSIKKTYIYHDGSAWVFATELPEHLQPGEGGGDTDGNNLGVLAAHTAGVVKDNGGNITGIYATCAATNATFNTDWSVEYTPAKAENYKLIRNGVTYNVGVPGSGTIVLFGQTELYLKQEGHTVGDGTLLPIQDGDILVVDGEWICNQDAASTVTITKTCILISEGTATFYAGEPDEEGGEGTEDQKPGLSAHPAGVNVDGGFVKGIYATCEDNNATFNTDWSVEYTPAAAENYKLIRDGVTYNVGVPGNGTIVLFGQTELYLKQEGHTVGDGTLLPIRDGDILVVEGQWNCIQDAGSTLTIDTTYILISNNTAEFSAKLPGETLPDDEDPADGQWSFSFDNGTVSTDVFKLRDSDLTMTVEELNSSMQLRLKPTKKDGTYCLWLDQDLKAGTVITMDVTFNRKLGTKSMSLYLYGAKENGDPITEGAASDTVPQIWFDGQGVNADFTGGNTNTQTVTFTVYEDCHGIAFMMTYGNQTANVIYLDNIAKQNTAAENENGLGVLSAHSAGVATDELTGAVKGIYATGVATNATFNTDWTVEYTPAVAGNYKLIRDGVTYDVGVPGSGTLVLFGQTELYLKQEGHTFGDGSLLPIRAGDILVIDGQWICNQDPASTVSITKTYILITDNSVVFSDKEDGFES